MSKKHLAGVLFLLMAGLLILIVIKASFFRKDVPTSIDTDVGRQAPPYTESDVRAYVRELMPLVEKAAGRRFKSIPTIKLVTSSQLVDVLVDDQKLYQDVKWPEIPPEQRNLQAWRESTAAASTYLGRYGMKAKILYMIPENLQPVMKQVGIDRQYEQAIVKLIVAHELTHALQEQYDLIQLYRRANNKDKGVALDAIFEGQAMFVQEKVATKLRLQDAEKQLLRAMAGSYNSNTYIGGLKFIDWHYRKGGNGRIWQILSSPPSKPSMIFHPETYSSVAPLEIDLKSVLNGLEKRFDERNWTKISNHALSQIGLRSDFSVMEPGELDRIIDNFMQGQSLDIRNDFAGIIISVEIMKNDSSARMAASSMYNLNAQTFKSMPEVTSLTEQNFYFPQKGKRQNVAPVKRIFVELSYGGDTKRQSFVWFAYGKIVIQFVTVNYDVSDDQIAATAEEIFRRLRKISPALVSP